MSFPLTHLMSDCVIQKDAPAGNDAIKILTAIHEKLCAIETLLTERKRESNHRAPLSPMRAPQSTYTGAPRMIEGVFDGEHMVDAEGKQYHVPPAYASKSKLVEGDMMQLMVFPDGRMLYRELARTERVSLSGFLKEEAGQYVCEAGGRCFRIREVSVKYFGMRAGDRLTISVPRGGSSAWAAVEGV